jgi:hypothetical protein
MKYRIGKIEKENRKSGQKTEEISLVRPVKEGKRGRRANKKQLERR